MRGPGRRPRGGLIGYEVHGRRQWALRRRYQDWLAMGAPDHTQKACDRRDEKMGTDWFRAHDKKAPRANGKKAAGRR